MSEEVYIPELRSINWLYHPLHSTDFNTLSDLTREELIYAVKVWTNMGEDCWKAHEVKQRYLDWAKWAEGQLLVRKILDE